MARSSYIYLMLSARNGQVLGAFTVKHELVAVGRRVADRADQILVQQFVDGPAGAGRLPTLLGTLREVMNGGS